MKRILLLIAVMSFCANTFAQEAKESLQTKCQDFAFSFFDKLAQKEQENVCFSPLSAQYALSMLINGADGETLRQIKNVLGLDEYAADDINQYFQQATSTLTTRPQFEYVPNGWQTEEEQRKTYENDYPICELANSLWMKNGFPFYEEFQNILLGMYQAEIGNVDFTTQEGINAINSWAKEKTHGLIPLLFGEPLSPTVVMLLANALYFKGTWSVPFNEDETTKQMFHNADGTNIEVDMMHANAYRSVAHTDKFTLVKLPYGINGDFSMTFYLPNEETMPQLTHEDWHSGRELLQPKRIGLNIPCFTTEGSYELKDILEEMGMVDAFYDFSADFSKLSPLSVVISKVNQLSKIIVNETGTEAAAVTYVMAGNTALPEQPEETITFDRPFYYTIEHNGTGSVLFVGRINQFDNNTAHGSINGINTPVHKTSPHNIYDLQGRHLNSIPQKGIYIQNGKKVLNPF